ncbi:MAG TPA: nucleotidyltransferase family protein [Steroidobacteraceae bacterium]|nr:nucleotidyltransferase family protein [Steroidobacteraceae bacterium]
MSSDSNRMPPLTAVQPALHRITESLASELGAPAAAPPAWSELEWRLAPAVAAIHGISPLLAGVLRWQGPPQWTRFLAEQRRHTLLRQQRIGELLETIGERSSSAGIAVVALKGAALQLAGVYAAGERPMADLDLLVRPADTDSAVAVLLALSYRDAGTTWKHQGFDPPGAERRAVLGEHADNPIKIDLHHRIRERLPLAPTDLTDLVFPPHAQPGLNAYPRAAALMAHVLVHAAGSMTHRGLRLIQLCDITRLARRMSAADWEDLLRLHGPSRRLWWAAPPLMMTARYFPDAVPREALARLARDCPWVLRQVAGRRKLADFSYSHLYIDPVPGIIWARSAAQAVRYLGSRIVPTKEQREQMRIASRTGPWSAEPRWHGQSQTRRILQWLSSRPTRTETLQPIHAALSRAH